MFKTRTATLSILLCFCICGTGFCAPLFKPHQPIITAKAAILIDQTSKKVLFQLNPDERLPPASTTKIMTGLLFAKTFPHPPIMVSPATATVPGDSVKLIPGNAYPATALLAAMLMVSANNASVAIAKSYPGGEAAFVHAMNRMTHQLGAPNTHFVNPSGLPAKNHYSSARDLAKIAAAAEQIPLFAKIVNTKTAQFPEPAGISGVNMVNTDNLLGSLQGLDGVKTGYTYAAGNCFVGDLHFNHHELIVVVLHSQNWQKDTLALFHYGETVDKMGKMGAAIAPYHTKSIAIGKKTPLGISPTTQIDRSGRSIQVSNGDVVESRSTASETIVHGISVAQRVPHDGKPLISQAANSVSNLKYVHNFGHRIFTDLSHIPVMRQTTSLYTWLIWLLSLVCILILLYAMYKNRKQQLRKVQRMPLSTLFNRQNRSVATRPAKSAEILKNIAPEFIFSATSPLRTTAEEWLQATLDDTSHLLDPVYRRHISAVFNSDPEGLKYILDPLITAEDKMVRVITTEIMAAYSPMESEERLLSILGSEGINQDCKSEAVRALYRLSGERHQPVFTKLVVEEGSLAAANVLVKHRELSGETVEAFNKCLRKKAKSNSPSDMQKHAQLLCVVNVIMATHSAEYEKETERLLQELPPRVKENIVCTLLSGSKSTWAMDRLIDQVLNGSAYPAMQALLNFIPSNVQQNLDARNAGMDAGEKTRSQILRWLCTGEGDMDSIKRLSSAGNETASGALALASANRWSVEGKSDGAMIAAAQIISLRLGYSEFSPEQLARTFRRTALQDNANPDNDIPEILQPLAEANTHPEVYEAVQACLQSEDGIDALLSTIATTKRSSVQSEELRFWIDKCNPYTRATLLSSLSRYPGSEDNEILEKLARSSDTNTRTLALRALRTAAESQTSEIVQPQVSLSEAA